MLQDCQNVQGFSTENEYIHIVNITKSYSAHRGSFQVPIHIRTPPRQNGNMDSSSRCPYCVTSGNFLDSELTGDQGNECCYQARQKKCNCERLAPELHYDGGLGGIKPL